MKLVDEDISVTLEEETPVRLTWRGQEYRVTNIVKKWRVDGRWWLTADLKGQTRRYFVLNLEGPRRKVITVEIKYESKVWTLTRISD